MEVWDIEEQMEKLRAKMVESALKLGIGHPYVYELSVELDKVHNEWLKGWKQTKLKQMYMSSGHIKQINETVDDGFCTVV